MKKGVITKLILVLLLASCASTKTSEPIVKDYQIGEKWTWKWERKVEGEVRAEGQDIQEVVKYKGTLGLWNGSDTLEIPIAPNKARAVRPSEIGLYRLVKSGNMSLNGRIMKVLQERPVRMLKLFPLKNCMWKLENSWPIKLNTREL